MKSKVRNKLPYLPNTAYERPKCQPEVTDIPESFILRFDKYGAIIPLAIN
jgi:hypothetical protein